MKTVFAKAKKCLVLCLLFFSAVFCAWSVESSDSSDVKTYEPAAYISRITFAGLKKTKPAYMANVMKKYDGIALSELNLQEVHTVLQAQGLFSEVDVQLLPDESATNLPEEGSITAEGADSSNGTPYILSVTVKEKITLIPLPFASYSSDGFMGGFMLMNMNAFGSKNMLVSGGIFSSKMQMAMLTFSKPAKDVSHPGFSAFASFSNRGEEITDFDDSTLFEYDALQFRTALSLQEKLTDSLSLSVGVNYGLYDIYDGDLDSLHNWGLSSGLSYTKMKWNGYFMLQNSLSLQAEVDYSTVDDFTEQCGFFAGFQVPIVPRVRIGLSATGAVSSEKSPVLLFDRGTVNSSIMNSNFRTDAIAGSMLMAEAALLKAKFATVSLYTTYEYDIAKDYDDSFVYSTGPGAGVKVYLQQVAFPAMNMGFSYNINQDFFKFVVSVGMGF